MLFHCDGATRSTTDRLVAIYFLPFIFFLIVTGDFFVLCARLLIFITLRGFFKRISRFWLFRFRLVELLDWSTSRSFLLFLIGGRRRSLLLLRSRTLFGARVVHTVSLTHCLGSFNVCFDERLTDHEAFTFRNLAPLLQQDLSLSFSIVGFRSWTIPLLEPSLPNDTAATSN